MFSPSVRHNGAMSLTNPAENPVPATGGAKHARVHLRLDGRSKRTLERAAAYEEMTMSRFVLSSAIAAAERVIESREKVVLPATDWDAFHDALLNPPEPNAVLKAAARRYHERISE